MATAAASSSAAESSLHELFGGEQMLLDSFQSQLLRMVDTASKNALAQFFNKNHEPLYRFLLSLYIASLTKAHPSRKRLPGDSSKQMNTAELMTVAGWAELMTESPPSAFVIQADGTFQEMRLDELTGPVLDDDDADDDDEDYTGDPAAAGEDDAVAPLISRDDKRVTDLQKGRRRSGGMVDMDRDTRTALDDFKKAISSQTDARRAEITPKESVVGGSRKAKRKKKARKGVAADGTHRRAQSTYSERSRLGSVRTGATPVTQMASMWQSLNQSKQSAKPKRVARVYKKKPKAGKKKKAVAEAVAASGAIDKSPETHGTTVGPLERKHSAWSTLMSLDGDSESPGHHERASTVGSFAMVGTSLALIRDHSQRGKYNPAMLVTQHTSDYSFSYAHESRDTMIEGVPRWEEDYDDDDAKKDYVTLRSGGSMDASDDEEPSHRRRGTLRGSIWEGVLDVDHVIKSPGVPLYRTHVDVSTGMMEVNMVDCILKAIVPSGRGSRRRTDDPISRTLGLDREIAITSTSAFCIFLPFFAVIAIGEVDKKKKKVLLKAIAERCRSEEDCAQALDCLIAAQDKKSAALFDIFKSAKFRGRKKGRDVGETLDVIASSTSLPPAKSSGIRRRGRSTTAESDSTSTSASSSKAPVCITQELPETAPEFFASFFKKKLKAGSEIKMHEGSDVRDPVREGVPRLSRCEVRRVIASNSKPLLVDLYVGDDFEFVSSTVILKLGDDLRRDRAVLDCFRLMNRFWAQRGLDYEEYPVQTYTYKCVAMGKDIGAIELVPGCKPLRLVGEIEKSISLAQTFNLVASAAGSYIASYVMGIRDRHFDNVLIRDSDCMLFHIDFGFVLGDKASLDTSKFAITQDLKRLMGEHWSEFVKTSVVAFLQLRERWKELVAFARAAFKYVLEPDLVEAFLRKKLMLDEPDEKAAKRISEKIKKSPDSVRTKFKNVIHDIATKVKRS